MRFKKSKPIPKKSQEIIKTLGEKLRELREEQRKKSPDWIGEIPTHCDICGRGLEKAFVDGMMDSGTWAIMCLDCHISDGVGLGTGKGQLYNILGEKLKG